ncbi:MAG: 1-phosphofructokinase family hexose kinase [Aquabacterium sp.]
MSRILTLTMNPALDLSTEVVKVEPVHKLRCAPACVHPGGGGINVARVAHRLGGEVLAVFPVGGVVGDSLRQLLAAEGVPCQAVPIAGETRESFSVHETASGQDFRFVLPGPTLTQAEAQACLAALAAQCRAGDWLVASGSLPPGVPPAFIGQLARLAHERGCQLVVDTSGPALVEALKTGVSLVKPSLRELREFTGLPLSDEAQWLAAARDLIAQGCAQTVALSLGEQGAMLVTATQAWRAPALSVDVASTIGAGDSFLAGLVWALAAGRLLEDAFAYGMAAGAAALLSAGTALSQAADVARFHDAVKLTPLKA